MKKLVVALFAVFVAFVSAPRADAATPDEAKELVLKAAEALAKDGKDKAFASFQDKAGPYWKGELYVFVINFDGVWEAYPPKPEAVGTSLLNLKDVDGKEFIKEMIEVAKTKGEGWVEYQWKNPQTNKIQPKASYIKRVGDVFVGGGVYK